MATTTWVIINSLKFLGCARMGPESLRFDAVTCVTCMMHGWDLGLCRQLFHQEKTRDLADTIPWEFKSKVLC